MSESEYRELRMRLTLCCLSTPLKAPYFAAWKAGELTRLHQALYELPRRRATLPETTLLDAVARVGTEATRVSQKAPYDHTPAEQLEADPWGNR